MGWNTIRKATEKDKDSLNLAAERFCKRHGIEFDEDYPAMLAVEFETDWHSARECGRAKYLRKLWRAIVRRALNHKWAEGIAYGYVGYSVD